MPFFVSCTFIIIAFVSSFSFLSISIYTSAQNASDQFIHIQIQAALTTLQDDGSSKKLGNDTLSAAYTMVTAIQHFNERNGEIIPMMRSPEIMNCPLKASFRILDSESVPGIAIQKFITNSKNWVPDIIIGASRTPVTGPVSIVAATSNIPQIAVASTGTWLSDKTSYPYLARTIPSDSASAKAIAKYFQSLGYKHVGILHVVDPFGTAYKETLFAECQKVGISLYPATYEFLNEDTLKAAIKELSNLKINIFVGVLFDSDIPLFANEGTKLGLFGEGKMWIFTEPMYDIAIRTANDPNIYKALDGNFFIIPIGSSLTNPSYISFRKRWLSFYKYRNIVNDNLPGGKGYIDIEDDLDIRDVKYNVSIQIEPYFLKYNVPRYFDPFAYDTIMAACFAACKTGLKFPVTPSINKREIFKELLKLRFNGVSGEVYFDKNGDRQNADIRLFNFQKIPDSDPSSLNLIDVGGWLSNTWTINYTTILFAGSSKLPPVDVTIPFHEQHLLSTSEFGFGYFFFASAMFICFVLFLWTIYFRGSKVVRRSQWSFLITFLVGNALSASAILPLMIDSGPTVNVACMIVPWLYSVGFVITVTSLMVKTYRVIKIFDNQELRKVRITDSQLFGTIFLFVIVDMIILASWTITDPLVSKLTIDSTDSFGNPTESHRMCSTNSSGYVVAVLLYHLIILLGSSYVAFYARMIPSSFHESKWINISMISYLQIYIMGVPGIAAVYNIPEARFFMMSIVIWVSTLVRVLVIFVPKMIALHIHGDIDDLSDEVAQFQRQRAIHGGLNEGASAGKQPVFYSAHPPTLDETVRIVGQNQLPESHLGQASVIPSKRYSATVPNRRFEHVSGDTSNMSLLENVVSLTSVSDSMKDAQQSTGSKSSFIHGSDLGFIVQSNFSQSNNNSNSNSNNEKHDNRDSMSSVYADVGSGSQSSSMSHVSRDEAELKKIKEQQVDKEPIYFETGVKRGSNTPRRRLIGENTTIQENLEDDKGDNEMSLV